MKKYKINHYLGLLPKEEYDTNLQALPKQLGISKRTFNRWRNYKLSCSAEIPVDKMFLIAGFFSVKIEDMFTVIPEKITKKDLDLDQLSGLAARLNLK